MNKRATEEPRAIIYVIFCVVLTITGLYLAYSFMGQSKVNITMFDYKMQYNIIVSQLVNTPNCLAYSEAYAYAAKTYSQVQPAVIDYAKLSELFTKKTMPQDCVRLPGGRNIYIKFTSVDNTPLVDGGDTSLIIHLSNGGWVLSDDTEWNKYSSEWDKALRDKGYDFSARKYYILIKQGDKTIPALMSVWLEP